MDYLLLLQFACFLFMSFCAIVLCITRLHMKWLNQRYEWSRWLIFTALIGLAMQFLMQMFLGFRARGDVMGAIINMLVYPPCYSLIAMGIYNIEATHANRWKMNIACIGIYACILTAFGIGYAQSGNFHIGSWVYVMVAMYGINLVYCTYMIMVEIRKRRKMLEVMAGNDILPYVRYARASVFVLLLSDFALPLTILYTKSLYIVGPLVLLAGLFFLLSFVALGYNYEPTEELLDKEEEEQAALEGCQAESLREATDGFELQGAALADDGETLQLPLPAERQKIICEKLDVWRAEKGYKDSSLNMITLSRSLDIPKTELSRYLSFSFNSTFRIWLAEVRFEAAKKMILENPDFSNDIISAECGFSSRSHLYRMFKEKEGCSPTAWREKNGQIMAQIGGGYLLPHEGKNKRLKEAYRFLLSLFCAIIGCGERKKWGKSWVVNRFDVNLGIFKFL